VINGVSKGFAMTGWRLGYMAAPLPIAKACEKLQGQVTSATCSISQYAAIEAMMTDPKTSPEIHEMVDTFRIRRDKMKEILSTIPGLKSHVPKGAFYFFPDVTSYFGKSYNGKEIQNACDLTMYLLDVGNVALVPGDAFGNPNCIRISYAASMDQLLEALNRIRKALTDLK
jgi:aspartate aminotransferase